MTTKRCATKLNIGDVAPDFTLPNQAGVDVRLSDFRGVRHVVLYFYPKDNTRNCIVESSSFRDQYEVFKNAGAEIIGVSSDSSSSHTQFAREYKLPFILLSDTKKEVRSRYGVPNTFGIIPGRVTFIIDKNGVIRHIFSSQFNPKSHVEQALRTLQSFSDKS